MKSVAHNEFELVSGAKFHVEYKKNVMEIRCQRDTDTFKEIIPKVASYFTLRQDLIFFADS